MTGRISIPALREAVALQDVYLVGADDWVLLALVEAVEAAEHVVEVFAERNPFVGYAVESLEAALARFDFREET